MSDGKQHKPVKTGVLAGKGKPPGYSWTVKVLDVAFKEAMGFLNEDQYDHMADQVRELARQKDPIHSQTVDVKQVQDSYEIRDKGGILFPLNVRVFFFVIPKLKTIVVSGAINKQNNGPTPVGTLITIDRRRRKYLEL